MLLVLLMGDWEKISFEPRTSQCAHSGIVLLRLAARAALGANVEVEVDVEGEMEVAVEEGEEEEEEEEQEEEEGVSEVEE